MCNFERQSDHDLIGEGSNPEPKRKLHELKTKL